MVSFYPGGGGNLNLSMVRGCAIFQGTFFMKVSGFKGIVFCQNSFIGELFWRSRIYGYDFQKLSRCMGILFRNFSGFMGGIFTI